MGEFDQVERLQAGLREWVLRTARSGRPGWRDIPAQAVLPWLCAAAFGPVLAEAVDLTSAFAVGRIGVLGSVGADVLAEVLTGAAGVAGSAAASGEPARGDLQQEISRSIEEVLAAQDTRAAALRSDIAMVLREIDAGGTVFRAAIEAGNEEAERDVLAAVEAVSAEFGDMAFLLADLVRAADEVQDSLVGQGAELTAAREQVGRQSADVRMIREELAVIEHRTRQWPPVPGGHEDPAHGWAGGCPYPGLRPYDQAHEAVFFGRERLTAELAGKLAETGIVMVSGGAGAGKTSLLGAGLIPALARGVQLPGSASWPVISMTPTARPLTELAEKLAALGGRDPDTVRQTLADAPGEAHLLLSEITQSAPLVLIIDQFEEAFANDGEDGRLERTAFIGAVCAAATKPAGSRSEPPARLVIAVRGDYLDRCAAYPQLVRAMEQAQLVLGPMPEARLRRAIAGPAEVSGLRLDSVLIDAIVADVRAAGGEHDGGVLPRLSQAMRATWERRDDGRLTAEGYDRSGRVARAIEVSAETVYGGLPEDQQAIARDVFRQLAAIGPDHRPVRRLVARSDLRERRPKRQRLQVDAVLGAFAGACLIVLDADGAEIAHDVLLQAWPRLRDWLEEDQATVILSAAWPKMRPGGIRAGRTLPSSTAEWSSRRPGRRPESGPPIRTVTRRLLRARPISCAPATGRRPGAGGGAGRWPRPWSCSSWPPWPGRAWRSGRPGIPQTSSGPPIYPDGWPRKVRRSRRWIRSRPRCSPGPRGGSRRQHRPGTACSSRWPSRCAGFWPPSQAW